MAGTGSAGMGTGFTKGMQTHTLTLIPGGFLYPLLNTTCAQTTKLKYLLKILPFVKPTCYLTQPCLLTR